MHLLKHLLNMAKRCFLLSDIETVAFTHCLIWHVGSHEQFTQREKSTLWLDSGDDMYYFFTTNVFDNKQTNIFIVNFMEWDFMRITSWRTRFFEIYTFNGNTCKSQPYVEQYWLYFSLKLWWKVWVWPHGVNGPMDFSPEAVSSSSRLR